MDIVEIPAEEIQIGDVLGEGERVVGTMCLGTLVGVELSGRHPGYHWRQIFADRTWQVGEKVKVLRDAPRAD